jgi:hypothetical protein
MLNQAGMNQPHSDLTKTVLDTANRLRWQVGDNVHEHIIEAIYTDATQICRPGC